MPTPVPRRLTALRRRVARLVDPDRAPGPASSSAGSGPIATGDAESAAAATAAPVIVAGAAPLATRVGIAASDRLSGLMADEWGQVDLVPGADRPTGLDLVVLELRGSDVVGWEGFRAQLAALVQGCLDTQVPVAVWLTAGPCSPPEWVGDAMVVAASTPALCDELASVTGRPVELLPAAAQPRRHRPDGPTHARHGATVIIEEQESTAAAAALSELVGPAIKPLPAEDVLVIGLGAPGESLGAVETTMKRNVQQRDWRVVERELGTRRVAVDLSGLSPDAAWTSVAAAASGTPLVSADGPTAGLPDDIAALVPRIDDSKQLRSEIVARLEQTELVAREGLQLRRAALSAHTAAHRARALVTHAGLTSDSGLLAPAARPISAIVPTNRLHELDNVFANVGRQAHPDLELVLVLHGLAADRAEITARAAAAGVEDLVILEADRSLTLGACMNLGVEAASGRYVAKMDDDNYYGAHFLSDLVDAFTYTDAGIVGKWCHYVWLRSSNAVVLRYPDSEHRPERRIQGGSMLFDGDVVRGLRFSDIPRAVDSDILDRAMAEGVTIYSADRFNYVSIRGTDRNDHTWTVADSTFMTKTGRLQFFGDPRAHVSV
ncbi:glycosyltransferase family 2 protein [Intrasporangium calvum]|uniref:glycosyltransferase family 2 protein n=1 Tax=Intrasporangium calvum TaxID=53358 RepID=UPI000DF61E75|nr:glycosyltransferase family A protein [Intrasporangium calvum]AXG14627.1 glycosyltransferase family 2 protein [Intrasporangium calvum]